ncbi:MAG: hypothetical protein ACTSYI_06715, partial [Promethearchaeota archaeon]
MLVVIFAPEAIFNIGNEISISTSSDLVYEEGTTDNEISWIISADSSSNSEYEITLDGTSVENGTWSIGSNVRYDVDGLSAGSYLYTLRASADNANPKEESITVTVNSLPPEIYISASDTLSYGTGQTNNIIYWDITGRSVVSGSYSISSNGTLLETGIWNHGVPVEYNVDGLLVGEYIYTLNATGSTAISKESNITVTVVLLSYEINPSSDLNFEQGTEGHNISWSVMGYTITNGSYEIFKNGTSVASGDWESEELIEYNVDNLTLGSYIFTFRAVSEGVDPIESNISVIVIPLVIRIEIIPSDNLIYVNGTIGHNISWIIIGFGIDNGTYEIYNDSTYLTNGSWSSGDTVYQDVEGLDLG